jgi:hypothetical protein
MIPANNVCGKEKEPCLRMDVSSELDKLLRMISVEESDSSMDSSNRSKFLKSTANQTAVPSLYERRIAFNKIGDRLLQAAVQAQQQQQQQQYQQKHYENHKGIENGSESLVKSKSPRDDYEDEQLIYELIDDVSVEAASDNIITREVDTKANENKARPNCKAPALLLNRNTSNGSTSTASAYSTLLLIGSEECGGNAPMNNATAHLGTASYRMRKYPKTNPTCR